jgi:hypothetical protein
MGGPVRKNGRERIDWWCWCADLLTCGKRHDRMGIRFVSDILVGDDAQRSTQTDIGNFSGVVGATAATVAADVKLKSFN